MIYLCTSEKSSLGMSREDLDEVTATTPDQAAAKFARQLVRDGQEPAKMFVRRPADDEWLVFRVSRPLTISGTGKRVSV